jgi:hypothetical protein
VQGVRGHGLLGIEVARLQGEELLARVAVVSERSVVDRQHLGRVAVGDPHRLRAALEQQPVVAFERSGAALGTLALAQLVVDRRDQPVDVGAQRRDLDGTGG